MGASPIGRLQFSHDSLRLNKKSDLIDDRLHELSSRRKKTCFLFFNVGETQLSALHEGADWSSWSSPCESFDLFF